MDLNANNKTILIAPLNWGLGHATRCIPIIKALQENDYIPIIASDGIALELLRKEFPYLQTLELPSYEIEYSKNGKNFKWKLLKNCPKMIEAVWNEKKLVKKWIKKYSIDGVISDNRLGVFSQKVPSVFMTHQLNVMTGNTTWITSMLHQHIIKKYKECWIPDLEETPNLTGKLGHIKKADFETRYIGPLSRMQKRETPKQYDLMIILSGPEPQRGLLEDKLRTEILKYNGKVVFIKGIIEKDQIKEQINNVTYYNFMNTRQLEQTFNGSDKVLCRSGYTTIMDLAKLNKKAFFIPTPGQYEQEYLAKKLKKEGLVPYAEQNDFRIENLEEIDLYKGLPRLDTALDWKTLFQVFEKN
ncbi:MULTISPECIES: glycosyltransferase [Flavobacterium]|uniref:Glycosyltransferase n=1 Tax=Flavobacterium gawalongense TaxID=2594432 RepID=A0A553BLT8_9FLAO|nr:glycosyltransferase [Flavobacterium gawalongense]TRX01215.1 glycosyltransferase [Flavobacterium gawalongense]TRX05260.1 glycosyltransferase [Flavobacterium gawalongense]TRX09163.1 glycosyltransferase [Flavobacterium gawalongense]TRX09202.1 glycosyltransferase [Flavobacterium gawalongense]TRX26659.1 glycosyltransferase [Flavobacterium gawalongense]